MSALTIENLGVSYRIDGQDYPALRNVSLEVAKGEVLGVVGESGSGKSTIGRAVLRLLPKNGRIDEGSVLFAGEDLTSLTDREFRSYRWSKIAAVFQGAMHVLDPVYTIGQQIQEAIRTSRPDISRREALTMAQEALGAVGIDRDRVSSYPHELSGGMRQRVCIAMALTLKPDLIVADEPTTALDVITQDRVLARLIELQQAHDCSLMLISHDMGVIAENCTTVAVVYAGRVVERGSVFDIFDDPAHPYTLGLINAIPVLLSEDELVSIPGFPPGLKDRTGGCPFVSRCPFRQPICETMPPLTEVSSGHWELCHFPERKEEFQLLAADPATWNGMRKVG